VKTVEYIRRNMHEQHMATVNIYYGKGTAAAE